MPVSRLLPDPALRATCTRFLPGHGPMEPRDWVKRMADSPHLPLALDVYNEGPGFSKIEQQTAELLGKESALFFAKGVVAQQAALQVHAAETGCRVVAVHPKSHLALDESDALDRLSGLCVRRIGADRAPFGVTELEAVDEPLAAVVVETPLRRSAFQATPWDELVAIAAWAKARKIPLHLDAARLWEVQPWYNRGLAEIAALADTIYVSFYKSLGGMGGSVLAGSKRAMDAAKPWRTRYGGDMPTIFPYVITALDGLATHLPRMADYHTHAKALATAIDAVPGLTAFPAIPHGNSFQVHFAAGIDAMERAAVALATEEKIWLFNRLEAASLPSHSYGEIVVGDATMAWTAEDLAAALGRLLQRAR